MPLDRGAVWDGLGVRIVSCKNTDFYEAECMCAPEKMTDYDKKFSREKKCEIVIKRKNVTT